MRPTLTCAPTMTPAMAAAKAVMLRRAGTARCGSATSESGWPACGHVGTAGTEVSLGCGRERRYPLPTVY